MDIKPIQEGESKSDKVESKEQPQSKAEPEKQEIPAKQVEQAKTIEKTPEDASKKEKDDPTIAGSKEPGADKSITQEERFRIARNEIMAELSQIMPLDEQEYQDIQNTVDKQLAFAAKSGGKLNLKQTKADIRTGLPLVRQELEHAANMEQSKAAKEQAQSQSNTRQNAQKNAQPTVRTSKSERER